MIFAPCSVLKIDKTETEPINNNGGACGYLNTVSFEISTVGCRAPLILFHFIFPSLERFFSNSPPRWHAADRANTHYCHNGFYRVSVTFSNLTDLSLYPVRLGTVGVLVHHAGHRAVVHFGVHAALAALRPRSALAVFALPKPFGTIVIVPFERVDVTVVD